MNSLINLLEESGYSRTPVPLTTPLVVHAVAGAGKSSLIRSFLSGNPNARAFTTGVPDTRNLLGASIQAFDPNPPSHTFNILDEYPQGAGKGSFQALFADPLQHSNISSIRQPHFIKTTSHRLGPSTAELLTQLGFTVEGLGTAQVVSSEPIFGSTIKGQVIALDDLIADYLSAHRCPFKRPLQTLGAEFPVVTVLSSVPLREVCCKEHLYVALSRHTSELHVRDPSHTFSPT